MSLAMQGGGNSAGMSSLGLGRTQPQATQGGVQGLMGQQRINTMQGGAGMGNLNMSRQNAIGVQRGAL
jgi:hypothetical protein